MLFRSNDTATTEIYTPRLTLSLHDALPISPAAVTSQSGGSCMIVVATDAPLTPRDLERLAARAVFGLARTGSSYDHGSGDYAIAFSTAESVRRRTDARSPSGPELANDAVSPLFQAVIEATEEAIYNSLCMAETMRGYRSHVGHALPLDQVRTLLRTAVEG